MGTHCDFQVGTLTRFYEIVFGLVHLSFVSVTAVFNQYHYFTTFLVHVKVVGAFENAPLLRNFGGRESEREREREREKERGRQRGRQRKQKIKASATVHNHSPGTCEATRQKQC